MIVSRRNRIRSRASAVVVAVATLAALTGCAVGPVGPNSWSEHIPEEDQRNLEQLAAATLVVSNPEDGPGELQLEAATTYLLLVEHDGYDEVAASDCVIDADPAVEVEELPQSEFNYLYGSDTFFTFGEFTTGEAILSVIDCDAPTTTIVAIPEAATV